MYATASTEPLDIIRANECEASPGLATSRFQALWNEIERLRAQNTVYRGAIETILTAAKAARELNAEQSKDATP